MDSQEETEDVSTYDDISELLESSRDEEIKEKSRKGSIPGKRANIDRDHEAVENRLYKQ